eukprot:10918843-Alexandrium_andersonii.AAC.1
MEVGHSGACAVGAPFAGGDVVRGGWGRAELASGFGVEPGNGAAGGSQSWGGGLAGSRAGARGCLLYTSPSPRD